MQGEQAGTFRRLRARERRAHGGGLRVTRGLHVDRPHVAADDRVPIRVITETAWHSLFARDMFIRASREELRSHEPQFVVLSAPGFHADPEVDGTRSEVFIVLNFGERLVLVGGTQYAGEIKKSMVNAALDGRLAGVPMRVDPVFGLAVPTASPDVPQQVLDPRPTWSDPSAYDAQAQKLARMFAKNFEAFAAEAPPEVASAGSRPAVSKLAGPAR
jgi:ATP-dependent phosphoenolpyruvate carboxykinase